MNKLYSIVMMLFILPLMVSCADAAEEASAPQAEQTQQVAAVPSAPAPAPAPAKSGYDEGIEYQLVEPPVPTSTGSKIEVVEVFAYYCPHCYRLEPMLNNWKKTLPADVVFVRYPAVFNKPAEIHARIYYTAEVLGVIDAMHQDIFDTFHKQRIKLVDMADIEVLFARHGVDAQTLHDTFNSFIVNNKVNRAREMGRRYGVDGVPTMIINGRYRTFSSITNGNANMFRVIEYLIGIERTAGK